MISPFPDPIMPKAHLLAAVFFLLAFMNQAAASEQPVKNNNLTSEYLLKQELLLNQLIVNIHLLQIDFLNKKARENMQDNLALLNQSIPALPEQSRDQETSKLLSSTLALWPIISRHAAWMADLPTYSRPPEASTLLLALAKLDRKLLLLRQKMLTRYPHRNQKLGFLEQALLMQRLSREYLSLTLSEMKEEKTASGRLQLQTLARHFEQKLEKLEKQFGDHAHAAQPIKQAQAAWNFIKVGIEQFPGKPVPEMVARYGNTIVSRMTSAHQMF
ncbi:hypothetical protein GZ78_02655 [Endozoicomonas numazuensis]|uniref:Uncharacterized protein n=2 Tax=Endozoicomonas numazuensis TaxID=1137799 RepID=A0A081NKJ4_9GAMM|nr:hypothetical protein GZ78_02655 [Endozoicomonas numazuensis]